MFLVKADVNVSDKLLQNLSEIRNNQQTNILDSINKLLHQQLNAKPKSILPLSNVGTFHIVFKCIMHDNTQYIVKLTTNTNNINIQSLEKERLIQDKLLEQGITVAKIIKSGSLEGQENINYIIMEYIDGITMDAASVSGKQKIISKLGTTLASVHNIDVNGFGLINSYLDKNSKLSASFNSWHNYLFNNINNHLDICLKNHFIEEGQYNASLNIISYFQKFSEFDNTKSKLLHSDLSAKNIILSNSENIVIIDWEDAVSGDPIFDVAMWGTFIGNHDNLGTLMQYYCNGKMLLSDNFYRKYWFYFFRILLAKTVHRFRFGYYLQDKIPAATRFKIAIDSLLKLIS